MAVFAIKGNLENYLKGDIFPLIARPPYGAITEIKVSNKAPVFLYYDRTSRAKVVGKYLKFDGITLDRAWEKTTIEYDNLKFLREKVGMQQGDFLVIAPLGKNKELSALLVMEYAEGDNLDHFIRRAALSQDKRNRDDLFDRLTGLARFFARLHGYRIIEKQVSAEMPQSFARKMSEHLRRYALRNRSGELDTVNSLMNGWWDRKEVFDDCEVIIHGDATTTNFVFCGEKVIAIDLEAMRQADRAWDLGFIAAELKLNFMMHAGDGNGAEPFIGHFLWEYGKACSDTRLFHKVTHKLPLFMALDFLRMARNDWLAENQRTYLVNEAISCLKYRP